MIQIDDFDLPIQVAEKIISGTKKVPASMLIKRHIKLLQEKKLEKQ